MTTTQLIKDWHQFAYSSSTVIAETTARIIIKHDCACDQCGLSIFDLQDFPNVKKGEVLCEDCYRAKYMDICEICEEYFYKAGKPIEQVLIISREAVEQYEMKIEPGFYRVKEWPFHYGDIVFGFEGLFPERIELIKQLDINSMLDKLFRGSKPMIMADECCHECMKKYTGQTRLVNNYIDREAGKKRIKLMREVIAAGK